MSDKRDSTKCPNPHRISVTNLLKEETLTFSLALLKGEITLPNTDASTFCNNYLTLYNLTKKTATNWPILKSKFKCLVDLERGDNRIILKYCTTCKRIVLNYTPRDTDHFVTPLYIICRNHSGEFQAPSECDNSIDSACSRVVLGSKLIQCLIAEKLFENGFGRKTFQIEADVIDKIPYCIQFYSNLPVEEARKMDQEALWIYFGREIMKSNFSSTKRKFLAFLSATWWDGGGVGAHAALGGGGLALFGTGCLHTWPTRVEDVFTCFLDPTPVDTSRIMDDSCFRGTYGGCFSTTLGSVCHELGHTFDLGHSREGIMGRGFDNIDMVFLPHSHCHKDSIQFATVQLISRLKVECFVASLSSRFNSPLRQPNSMNIQNSSPSNTETNCNTSNSLPNNTETNGNTSNSLPDNTETNGNTSNSLTDDTTTNFSSLIHRGGSQNCNITSDSYSNTSRPSKSELNTSSNGNDLITTSYNESSTNTHRINNSYDTNDSNSNTTSNSELNTNGNNLLNTTSYDESSTNTHRSNHLNTTSHCELSTNSNRSNHSNTASNIESNTDSNISSTDIDNSNTICSDENNLNPATNSIDNLNDTCNTRQNFNSISSRICVSSDTDSTSNNTNENHLNTLSDNESSFTSNIGDNNSNNICDNSNTTSIKSNNRSHFGQPTNAISNTSSNPSSKNSYPNNNSANNTSKSDNSNITSNSNLRTPCNNSSNNSSNRAQSDSPRRSTNSPARLVANSSPSKQLSTNRNKRNNNVLVVQQQIKNKDSDLLASGVDDRTYWTPSCATLLAYHKWFNCEPHSNRDELKYNAVRGLVTSSAGLRVVELRGDESLVLHSWQFTGSRPKTQLVVPKQISARAQLIVVEDNNGNIIKQDLTTTTTTVANNFNNNC